jgi:hypothetical protein
MSKTPQPDRSDQIQAQARRRAELILKVRSGLITATTAAAELGVSRKTYYEWEKRGLQAMMAALEDRQTGRPKKPVDSEKETLRNQVDALEKRLAESEQTLLIREMISDLPGIVGRRAENEQPGDVPSRKKGRKESPGNNRRRKR